MSSKNISPPEGESSPARRPKRVDLPDPDGPTTASDVFEEISKSILSKIFISSPLKITYFDKFLAFIIIK